MEWGGDTHTLNDSRGFPPPLRLWGLSHFYPPTQSNRKRDGLVCDPVSIGIDVSGVKCSSSPFLKVSLLQFWRCWRIPSDRSSASNIETNQNYHNCPTSARHPTKIILNGASALCAQLFCVFKKQITDQVIIILLKIEREKKKRALSHYRIAVSRKTTRGSLTAVKSIRVCVARVFTQCVCQCGVCVCIYIVSLGLCVACVSASAIIPKRITALCVWCNPAWWESKILLVFILAGPFFFCEKVNVEFSPWVFIMNQRLLLVKTTRGKWPHWTWKKKEKGKTKRKRKQLCVWKKKEEEEEEEEEVGNPNLSLSLLFLFLSFPQRLGERRVNPSIINWINIRDWKAKLIHRPIYKHNTSLFLRCSAHLDFSPIRLRNNNNWWWKLFWF